MGERALLPPAERKLFRQNRRKERLAHMADKIFFRAAKDIELKQYMYKTDEELRAAPACLTPTQIRRVREWENPKKQVAYGIESSQNIFTTLMKAEQQKGTVQINVENMSIQLPEKAPETIEAIVIEQDSEK